MPKERRRHTPSPSLSPVPSGAGGASAGRAASRHSVAWQGLGQGDEMPSLAMPPRAEGRRALTFVLAVSPHWCGQVSGRSRLHSLPNFLPLSGPWFLVDMSAAALLCPTSAATSEPTALRDGQSMTSRGLAQDCEAPVLAAAVPLSRLVAERERAYAQKVRMQRHGGFTSCGAVCPSFRESLL